MATVNPAGSSTYSDVSANVRLIPAELLRTEDTLNSKQFVFLFLKVSSHNVDSNHSDM